MCSDPITSVNKDTGEEVTFACRTCDECIATRRHGWEARAMAEKAVHPHTLCVALTYDLSTKENREGRQMFCYADVIAFNKRLRRACEYYAQKHELGIVPYVRFIVAGEQGDKGDKHCHWHIILYSNVDLRRIGEFIGRVDGKRRPLNWPHDERHFMTVGKRKRRLNWSIWGRGFVTLQEPDQGGMHYVLSYCLKDQFTHEKSEGTMREAKSENFATGLFRMSKRPAIGEEFLVRKMEGLLAKGAVLPSLQIMIPGFHGYWHPNGTFRDKLLWHLAAVNRRIFWATGANAPQWSTLLASVSENPADMEILSGQETEEERVYREATERLVARLEKIRDTETGLAAFKADWLICCQRCLRYPSRFWTWKDTGRVEYHQEGDYYTYRSQTGKASRDQFSIEQAVGGKASCETCGGTKGLIGIPEEGQRARRQAYLAAKHGSPEMPPP